jgi:hypothetical protein
VVTASRIMAETWASLQECPPSRRLSQAAATGQKLWLRLSRNHPLGFRVADLLRKEPDMTFRVYGRVLNCSIRFFLRLAANGRSGVSRALTVRLDIVDIHVDDDRRAAESTGDL